MNPEDAEAIRRARWVKSYRLAHRDAERWAISSRGIRHSVETQDRIFRMAEQLRERRDWPNASPLFSLLQAIDDAASWESRPNEAPTPISASAAGLAGYKMLFGTLPPVREHDWPAGFERTDEAECELATFGLRARGFDPVVFDGRDPAAYVWALFEVSERQAACDEVVRGHEHRAYPPRGLAVVSTPLRMQGHEPVRRQGRPPAPLHRSPQPAGVRS